jgi:hypothetical protein
MDFGLVLENIMVFSTVGQGWDFNQIWKESGFSVQNLDDV